MQAEPRHPDNDRTHDAHSVGELGDVGADMVCTRARRLGLVSLRRVGTMRSPCHGGPVTPSFTDTTARC